MKRNMTTWIFNLAFNIKEDANHEALPSSKAVRGKSQYFPCVPFAVVWWMHEKSSFPFPLKSVESPNMRLVVVSLRGIHCHIERRDIAECECVPQGSNFGFHHVLYLYWRAAVFYSFMTCNFVCLHIILEHFKQNKGGLEKTKKGCLFSFV